MMALGSPQDFDEWAEEYDASVLATDGFPFGEYARVLRHAVALAAAEPLNSVLDLGIGTGNLAQYFVELGCRVWGIDFSAKMLGLARSKLPMVRLAKADILGAWPGEFHRRYDRLVSAYVFHHFEPGEKVDLLLRLSRDHVTPRGRIIVADIAFPSVAALELARVRWADAWDEEHYWVAERDVPACEGAGLAVHYEQVVEFAGVFAVQASITGTG